MRSYRSDLSRRLGPVFAEQAAQPATTSDRNVAAKPAEQVAGLVFRAMAAAYKPSHGGYPSVKARA